MILINKSKLVILLICCAMFCTCSVFSQLKISTVDYFGESDIDTIQLANIASALEGNDLRSGEALLRSELGKMKGVGQFTLKKVCCDANGVNIFVGLSSEKNLSKVRQRRTFTPAALPHNFFKTYQEYLTKLKVAVEKGESDDNLDHGYSLMKNEAVRALQVSLPDMVSPHQKMIAEVMCHSDQEEHRAAAAFLLGYCKNKSVSLRGFKDALNDPSPDVRNNVLRAMTAILVSEKQSVSRLMRAARSRIMEMLHSLEWTDRDKAMFALVAITERREQSFLDKLKRKAGSALEQMSKWKSRPHAMMAYVLLGRVAGKADEQIFQDWQAGKS